MSQVLPRAARAANSSPDSRATALPAQAAVGAGAGVVASSVAAADTSSTGTEATTKAGTVVAVVAAADVSSTTDPRVATRVAAAPAVVLRNRWESR